MLVFNIPMKNMNLPKSPKAETGYLISKNLISRRNQDGSVILMKLDETSYFYKITGIIAAMWNELESAKSASALIEHYSGFYPDFKVRMGKEIPQLLEKLAKWGLLEEVSAPQDMYFKTSKAPTEKFEPGEAREFNLEAIEAEVMSENIYLDVFAGSDLRLKKDILPLMDSLEKVVQLDGVRYHWDSERAVTVGNFGVSQVPQVGFIAQQVATVMPELVRADEKSGMLAIEYSKMSSYLVEAIKELNQKVHTQAERISELEQRLK